MVSCCYHVFSFKDCAEDVEVLKELLIEPVENVGFSFCADDPLLNDYLCSAF